MAGGPEMKIYLKGLLVVIAMVCASLQVMAEPAPFTHEADVRFKKLEQKKTMRFVYDFSRVGGTIGTVNFIDQFGNPATLPAGSAILRAYFYVTTQMAPTGTTINVTCGSATILAATDETAVAAGGTFDGAVTQASAFSAALLVGPNPCVIKNTIAVHNLTSGKVFGYVDYVNVLGN
jgi:hypothetical protein